MKASEVVSRGVHSAPDSHDSTSASPSLPLLSPPLLTGFREYHSLKILEIKMLFDEFYSVLDINIP